MARIHILGASGAGTTTLGTALAERLRCAHFDSDDYFWQPSDPPFTAPRNSAERVALLLKDIEGKTDWVFSGSAINWAMPLEPLYELVVFLYLDPAIRMERVRQRELARHGARILPGGDMELGSRAFLAWAASYETGPARRNLAAHQYWLSSRTCPVLRLDSARPLEELVEKAMAAISGVARDR